MIFFDQRDVADEDVKSIKYSVGDGIGNSYQSFKNIGIDSDNYE